MSHKKRYTLSGMVFRKERLLNEIDKDHKFSKSDIQDNLSHPLLKDIRKPKDNYPKLSEVQLVRHYSRLARQNYSWEDGLYPLGSCTMKYNPVLNEWAANNASFSKLHPYLPENLSQGAMQIIFETQQAIAEIVDLPGSTLTPAAGAHGELAGVFMMRNYFEERNEKRNIILIPDSAHGTNPASAAMGGFQVKKVPSNEQGLTDIEALEKLTDENTAALMITNPNTLGIFESETLKIKNILEKKGALLFVDGANLNALIGKISFKKMGVDLSQLNLHKTFSTPHGGGGPGQGALVCSERMLPYLPEPHIKCAEKEGRLVYEFYKPQKSIGAIKGCYGQFAVILRAWVYIKKWGNQIHKSAERAVLNANYMRKRLEPYLSIASKLPTMHEAVFNHNTLKDKDITTMNFAKALIDRGFYAPTVYFPLNVPGAIMVEPTETETKEEMDDFIDAVKDIFETIEKEPEKIKNSPLNSFVRKIDEVQASKNPILTWDMI
ncbi:MAG: aminomethyl-transferring glycine dehydrogenase subunit GcvPB [Spirochaetia bacterium]|nr:aminomethyl-transferring glycine dehydrogenase subunit GcvPB [Spirochaetia bacterium]